MATSGSGSGAVRMGSSAAAPARRRGGGGRLGVAWGRQKQSEWTGVRPRPGCRWAAEIRMPKTREKLWIGTFESDRMAALAYDAAVYCFYGNKELPRTRRYNFPGIVLHSGIAIPEEAIGKLTVASVKAIADEHARTADAMLSSLECAEEVAPPPLRPPARAAGPSAAVGAGAGAGASAPSITTYHDVANAMAGNNPAASAFYGGEFIFPFDDIDALARVMGFVPGGGEY